MGRWVKTNSCKKMKIMDFWRKWPWPSPELRDLDIQSVWNLRKSIQHLRKPKNRHQDHQNRLISYWHMRPSMDGGHLGFPSFSAKCSRVPAWHPPVFHSTWSHESESTITHCGTSNARLPLSAAGLRGNSHYRWTYDVPHDYKKYMSLHIVQFLKARMKSGFLQDEEINISCFRSSAYRSSRPIWAVSWVLHSSLFATMFSNNRCDLKTYHQYSYSEMDTRMPCTCNRTVWHNNLCPDGA